MRNILLLFPLLLFASYTTRAQHAADKKARTFSKTFIPLRDSTGIYVGDGDSDRLFYYSLVPKGAIKGALVLFPPNGQTARLQRKQ